MEFFNKKEIDPDETEYINYQDKYISELKKENNEEENKSWIFGINFLNF